MKKNFTYIKVSNEFRKSDASKESVEKLYDLLYELKDSDRTKNEDLILSNLYSLLRFHQSAYEVFKSAADLTDRKNTSKLYVMEEKAKSHKNNFFIKDNRMLKTKTDVVKLFPGNFIKKEHDRNKFSIDTENIIIFNKIVKSDKFEIYIYDNHRIEDYIEKVINYLYWLGNCKRELISFYNSKLSAITEKTADEDWYDTLEIFSAKIIVGQNGNLFANISGGDVFAQDHILDIETESNKIIAMNYDG